MIRKRTFVRRMAACIAFGACLGVAATAGAQTVERKPPPPAKDQARKDEKAAPPRPSTPEKPRGEDRIRLDAPVSFPVDI
jgi:hypothetical protein